jgi:hypothetical protein
MNRPGALDQGRCHVQRYELCPGGEERRRDAIRRDITDKDVELQTSLAKSLGMPMSMAPGE